MIEVKIKAFDEFVYFGDLVNSDELPKRLRTSM